MDSPIEFLYSLILILSIESLQQTLNERCFWTVAVRTWPGDHYCSQKPLGPTDQSVSKPEIRWTDDYCRSTVSDSWSPIRKCERSKSKKERYQVTWSDLRLVLSKVCFTLLSIPKNFQGAQWHEIFWMSSKHVLTSSRSAIRFGKLCWSDPHVVQRVSFPSSRLNEL